MARVRLRGVEHVTAHEAELVARPGVREKQLGAGAEVVIDHDLPTLREEAVREVAADEPRAAGDKRSHAVSPVRPSSRRMILAAAIRSAARKSGACPASASGSPT